MGKMFGNLTTDNLEETGDRVGGFQPHEQDIYGGNVKMAYALQSRNGAHGVSLELEMEGGKTHRETIYITNRAGENFFKDKNDPSKKVPLPGFTTIDDLCLLTTGEPLADQDTEEKKVKVYDPNEKKEVVQNMPVLVGLLGKPISFGLLKVIENQNEKQGDKYVPKADGSTRTSNTVDKFFHAETGRTVSEYRHEIESAEFREEWLKANKGKVRDKTVKTGGAGGAGQSGSGAPGGAAGSGSPRKKLFGS